MKNINVLRVTRIFGLIISLIVTFYVLGQYDEITDFYTRRTENNNDLIELNNRILDYYQIDLEKNEELYELSQKIEYETHMVNGLQPRTDYARYYWCFFMGAFWLGLWSIEPKSKSSKKEIKTD